MRVVRKQGNPKPWSHQDDERLLGLVEEYRSRNGDPEWGRICAKMLRTIPACANRYSVLKSRSSQITMPERPASAPGSGTIVDQAKDVLRRAGFTDRQIMVMPLDTLMREANMRLKAMGHPQLGRKTEWLV